MRAATIKDFYSDKMYIFMCQLTCHKADIEEIRTTAIIFVTVGITIAGKMEIIVF